MEATNHFLEEVSVDIYRPINNVQRNLFDAIRKGDLESVRKTLSMSKPKCDLNYLNSSGKTALQVAGSLQDTKVRNDMIRTLLSSGADLEQALFYAVNECDVGGVKVLLKFHRQPSLCAVSASKRQGHVTPFMLGIFLQNLQIVKLFMKHGFTICDPRNPQWPKNSTGVAKEKLQPAVYRLNAYRALTSPLYIAASFLRNVQSGPDPIYRTCLLNKELCTLAKEEYEFKKEYIELADGCKEFAVTLLNVCRSTKEIRCVMEMRNEEGITSNIEKELLNILQFAIAPRNERVYRICIYSSNPETFLVKIIIFHPN